MKRIDRTIPINHMDSDKYERSKRLEWFDLQRVSKTRVLVVGAGAIGNEVCKNLILSGFRNISVVDMDHIVRSNLNRCIFFSENDAEERKMKADVIAKKLLMIEPESKIKTYVDAIENLSDDFIPSFDVVLGCLDNISARLHVNAHCYYNKIPYIDGGTNGLIGKVQVVLPPETSCLECGMNNTHNKIREMRVSCTGRDVSFFEPKIASDINTTSIIASFQVLELLKIVHEQLDQVIRNIFYFDANRNVSEILEIPINPTCCHHKDNR